MIALAVTALVLTTAIPAALAPVRHRVPRWVPAVTAASTLGIAGLAATAVDDPVTGAPLVIAVVLVVAAAIVGGTVVVPTVFHLAPRPDVPTGSGENRPDRTTPDVLRGGLVIGTLERTAIVVSVLARWPEGIAVVLAVKGLARYPELRDPGASEYFIIGTFTSVLWALAAGGVGVALAN